MNFTTLLLLACTIFAGAYGVAQTNVGALAQKRTRNVDKFLFFSARPRAPVGIRGRSRLGHGRGCSSFGATCRA
jgi:hypothetical protein